MQSERSQRVERLYQLALQRGTDLRAEFLAEACDGDYELRREVEWLLAGRSPDEPGPGVHVGPYLLEDRLGAGGMGEVFRAIDIRLRRTVAIKFLLAGRVSDAGYKRRFLQEARAVSALNHPNIVALYDICEQDGRDFLVMEHVPGQALNNLIVGGGMPIESVLRLGEQVASALAAAHEAGVLHRDIKPANIMVTPDRQVKVLDFGIASVTQRDAMGGGETPTATRLTIPGTVVGTVSYMSPEQARGAVMDARSDIFSLGCVLYEAATGQRPFRGGSALEIMHEILVATPAAPGSLRAGLPQAFDELVASCLEKNPERRPASALDVANGLRSLSSPTVAGATGTRPGRRSVAVMPFRFRTARPEDQFLSLALAESLINRLGSSPELVLRPIASVLRYAASDVEWTQVARDLNVEHVVEGSIQKMGAKVRVMVQAVHAHDGRTFHSARHDGEMEDLFGLQDRIADAVADAFFPGKEAGGEPGRAGRGGDAPAVPPTANPLAYELYLRAADRVAQMNKFDTGSAIEMLSRVVEIDPDFADAWGRLAHACSQMGMHLDPDPQWFDRAEHAIARTLELDPVQCDALCARGQILWSPARGFQNLPALRAMNAALKIQPGRYNFRHFRGVILFHLGFHEQADRDMQESLLANPAYALAITSHAVIAQYRGDFAAAREYFVRSLAADPTLMHANIFAPMNLLLLDRLGEAREMIRKARQIVPEESMVASLEGLLAAKEGDFARAEQLADKAGSGGKSLTHTHHTWHCSAGVYALCGKPEKAVSELRRCLTMGLPNYRLFTIDPHLKTLHDEPEFTALMSAMRREYDQYRTVVDVTTELRGS